MPLNFFNLQNTIGMIADESNVILVWDYSCANRNQTITVCVSQFYPLPDCVPIKALLLNSVLFGQPTCHYIEVP